MKAQAGELEKNTDAVVLDIKQLGDSVRRASSFNYITLR